jgi:hypothetical protein
MAVEALKSAGITNADATPRVPNNARVFGGVLREAVGTIHFAASSSIGSIARLCRIPSNARVSQVIVSCDAFDTTGAGDIGIYKATAQGGAVVDADHFASAVVFTSILLGSDVTHESTVNGIEDAEKPLWEALGLSADPQVDYDVAITLTAANGAGASPDVTVKVRYAV